MDNKQTPLAVGLPSSHTMGESLFPYIHIKMHHLLKDIPFPFKEVLIIGDYNRTATTISRAEKIDKLFNWKRPAATLDNSRLIINCYPGQEYVFHYACLVSTYLNLLSQNIRVRYEMPSTRTCWQAIYDSNLKDLEEVEVVLLGYVEPLSTLLPPQDWQGSGDFLWKVGKINSKRVAVLGCKHSYWADISQRLVTFLASRGVKTVVYIGKLGILNPAYAPNQYLATGSCSYLNGKLLQWDNLFEQCNHPAIVRGKHYSLASVIQEDKNWLQSVKQDYDFVDPEIGYMAYGAMTQGINFSYLHICSDNLSNKFCEDLSNERNDVVSQKRLKLLALINQCLLDVL